MENRLFYDMKDVRYFKAVYFWKGIATGVFIGILGTLVTAYVIGYYLGIN